jgi:hypothetical protein
MPWSHKRGPGEFHHPPRHPQMTERSQFSDLASSMTSVRQIEANRRNALGSTGPKTDTRRQHASQNAVRHGLTAETVIVPPEDADEPSRTAQTGFSQERTIATLFRLGGQPDLRSHEAATDHRNALLNCEVQLAVARRFLRLADLDNGVFERLGRYEAALWRQVRQTLFTLEALRWRTSNSRKWHTQHSWRRSN